MDLNVFFELRDAGIDAKGACIQAKSLGYSSVSCTRMLREVYGLSLVSAKSLIVEVDNKGISLSEYQKNLLPSLKKILKKKND